MGVAQSFRQGQMLSFRLVTQSYRPRNLSLVAAVPHEIFFWGDVRSINDAASPLRATAKNGWEGGGRRGVKLAVAMGSHWLNMQCVEAGCM